MKTKSKKKKIILFTLLAVLLLLIAAAVWFFQFTHSGYKMTVPFRPSFEEIEDNVYINKGYAGSEEEVLEQILLAKGRGTAFFGELQGTDETVFIICDDKKLLKKLGSEKDTSTLLFPVRRHYICISDEYLNQDIVSHELTHAELHSRLNDNALRKLPTWFDEGIATQNDYREQYSAEEWEKQTDHGANVLAPEDMDTPEEFYAGTAEDRRFRYLNAKHLVSEWMAAHGQEGLIALIGALNSGTDFETAFGG